MSGVLVVTAADSPEQSTRDRIDVRVAVSPVSGALAVTAAGGPEQSTRDCGEVLAAVSPESGVLAVTAADDSEHSTRDWATIRGVLMAAVGCVAWLLVTALNETGWAAVCFPSCGSSPVDAAFVWAVVCLLICTLVMMMTAAGCDVLMVTTVEGAWRTAVCFPLCGLTPAGCAAVGWAAVCLCAVWLTMSVSGAGRRWWQSAVSGGGRFSCSFWQSILPAISERVHHLCFAETGVIHAALRSREDRERLDLRQRRRRKLFSLSGLRSSSPRRRRSLASTSYRVCPPAPLVLLLVSQTWALGLGGGR